MLFVDGSAVQGGGRNYLSHYVRVEVAKMKTTRLSDPIYLAREDRAHAVTFSSSTDPEVVVTHPAMPGLELHIPKGAVIRTPDGKIVTPPIRSIAPRDCSFISAVDMYLSDTIPLVLSRTYRQNDPVSNFVSSVITTPYAAVEGGRW